VLEIMRGELATALALTGCTDVRKAGPQLLIDAKTALKEAAPLARARRQSLAAD
jgi:isopentenyl diphosphate isomerase/L-lactate dehydrogenase-like FMN-dependent dehydrogenase